MSVKTWTGCYETMSVRTWTDVTQHTSVKTWTGCYKLLVQVWCTWLYNKSILLLCLCVQILQCEEIRAATLKNALIKTSFWYLLHAAASQVTENNRWQNWLKLSVFCLNDSAFIYLQCWIHCFIIFSKAEHLICSHSTESIYILVIAVCSR